MTGFHLYAVAWCFTGACDIKFAASKHQLHHREGPPGACCSLTMQASMASKLRSRRSPTLINPPVTSSVSEPIAVSLASDYMS